jgi:2-methylcitrate dehydratase PrpD
MAHDVLKYHMPVNATEARFSLPFCLAGALLNGRLGIEDFEDEMVRQTKVREQMKIVDVIVEPSLDKPGIALGARLTITTADGRAYTHELDKPQGSAEDPLPWEAVVSKFRNCAASILDDDEATEIVRHVGQLEQLENIREMVNILVRVP